VRIPKIAFCQSCLEKKSACTLKLPQNVHRKGTQASTNHNTKKEILKKFNQLGLALFMSYPLTAGLLDCHVLTIIGVNKMLTPIMVRMDVAAAEPNNIAPSPLLKSL